MPADQLLSLPRCAKALELNRGALKRYVDGHPELNHATQPGRYLLDPAEVAAHREEQAQHKIDATERRAAEAEKAAVYREARSRREAAAAALTELQLQERRGELLPRAVVEQAIIHAGRMLQQNAKVMTRDLARKIAGMKDARQIQRVLDDAYARLIAQVRKDAQLDD